MVEIMYADVQSQFIIRTQRVRRIQSKIVFFEMFLGHVTTKGIHGEDQAYPGRKVEIGVPNYKQSKSCKLFLSLSLVVAGIHDRRNTRRPQGENDQEEASLGRRSCELINFGVISQEGKECESHGDDHHRSGPFVSPGATRQTTVEYREVRAKGDGRRNHLAPPHGLARIARGLLLVVVSHLVFVGVLDSFDGVLDFVRVS